VPKGIMVVQSSPSAPDREDEYNDWYDNTHIPQIRAIPGFTAARRYKLTGPASPDAPAYLAVYEIEADDLAAPLAELRARSASGRLGLSGVLSLDPPPVVTVYELIG
jgi:hypothetical protein